MAGNGYPKVTAKAWGALRARAAAAPSTKFTPSAVAAMMGMANPNSARDNTVSPLRRMGLLDEDGALTDRGNKWRVDGTFDDACQEILDEIYPAELASLVEGDGSPDLTAIKTWFDHQGFGDSNARQMAATYAMVASKVIPDPPAPAATGSGERSTRPRRAKVAATKAKAPTPKDGEVKDDPPTPPPPPPPKTGPEIHLDIQIHIAADADAEQIDQIFASMARHLYDQ